VEEVSSRLTSGTRFEPGKVVVAGLKQESSPSPLFS
jgi:hypothetical protein